MSGEPFALRWRWWKHTWTFQAAHKPLCARFHHDVLRLGPLRLCRSCAALWGSFAATLCTAPLYAGLLNTVTGLAVAALAALVLYACAPRRYRAASRARRDLLRGGAGVLAALSLAHLFGPGWPVGLVLLAGLAAGWRALQRARRVLHQTGDICAGCPELDQPGICSGFHGQAEKIRAYEEEATDWLACDIAKARPSRADGPAALHGTRNEV